MVGSNGLLYWTSTGECINAAQTTYEKYFENCGDGSKIAKMEDLYSPIRVFYQNLKGGFCVSINNGNFDQDIDKNYTAGNSTEFVNFIKKFKNVSESNEKGILTSSDTWRYNIPKLYEKNTFKFNEYSGYTPSEPLITHSTTNATYDTIKIPIVSPYGKCVNDIDSARYLLNKNFICSEKLIYETNSCQKINNKFSKYDPSLELLTYDNSANKTIFVTGGVNITVFKSKNKLFYTQSILKSVSGVSGLQNFGGVNNQCMCTNVVTKVIFEFLMTNAQITEYRINYYLEDFTSDCGKTEFIPINYQVNFVGNKDVFFLLKYFLGGRLFSIGEPWVCQGKTNFGWKFRYNFTI
jgi:hypothetical protein